MESTLTSTPTTGGSSTIKKFYSMKTSQNSSLLNNNWEVEKESNAHKLDTLLQDLKKERESTRKNDFYSNTNVEEYDSFLRDKKQYYSTNQDGTKYVYSKAEILSDTIPFEERNNTFSASCLYRNDTKKQFSQKDGLLNSNISKDYFSDRQNVMESIDVNRSKQLSEDILPLPGTKVTTTVRTYTYEVPADSRVNHDVIIEDVIHTSNNSLSTSPTDHNSQRYRYEEHFNKNSNEGFPVPNKQKTIKYLATSKKYIDQNISSSSPIDNTISQYPNTLHPLTNTTYYLNSNESNKYIDHIQTTEIPRNSTSIQHMVESTSQVHDNYNPGITYKCAENNTRNSQEQQISLAQPFPVYDENDGLEKQSQPPKYLNELLTNLNGSSTYNKITIDGYNPKLEVETAVAKENNNKIIVPSKNVEGPPVYYPPNHEMTFRKEEKSAGYKAGGGWARARGAYEYESESKSKSKSKSGGAVVPVCLPLCCAMPCSIM